MPNGAVELELIVDVPADQVATVRQDYEDEGYAVKTTQQASGLWSVAAAKRG